MTLRLHQLIETFGADAELLDPRFFAVSAGAVMALVDPMMR
jgi:hypothetical protein